MKIPKEMCAYASLRELVCGAGGTLVEEHLNPEVFGSAYAVFAGQSGGKFRLVWDGKESCGLLQALTASEQWIDEGPIVRERFGGGFSNQPELLATAKRLSVGGSSEALV